MAQEVLRGVCRMVGCRGSGILRRAWKLNHLSSSTFTPVCAHNKVQGMSLDE